MIRRFKKWASGEKASTSDATEAAYRAIENRLGELQSRLQVFFDEHGRQYGEHQHVLASALLGTGAILTKTNEPQRALNFQRVGLAISPEIVDGYRHLFQTCIDLRHADMALEAFGCALNLPIVETPPRRGGAPVVSLDDLLERRRTPATPQPLTIYTSLMPRRLDVQKAAIDSWLRAGFVVRSVNIRKEIDELAPSFPNIDFIEFVSEDGFLVPIAHLCHLMAADENPIVGLVNSDIIFLDPKKLLRTLQTEHRHSLVFGHRYDLQSPADTIGRPYREGFDYFFMEREDWRKLAGTHLLMGAPWWDYWVPLVARMHGLVLKKPRDAQIVHIMHPFTYDTKISLHYAHKFWGDFAVAAREVEPGAHDEFAALLCRAGRMLTQELSLESPDSFNRLFDFGFMAKVMIDASTLELD